MHIRKKNRFYYIYTFFTISPVMSKNFNFFKYILLKIYFRDASTGGIGFTLQLKMADWESSNLEHLFIFKFDSCRVTVCKITNLKVIDKDLNNTFSKVFGENKNILIVIYAFLDLDFF